MMILPGEYVDETSITFKNIEYYVEKEYGIFKPSVGYKYTFEINVQTQSGWAVINYILADGVSLFENSKFERLEVLVYPRSPNATDEDVNHMIDSYEQTYVNWRDNPQPVGAKLFNLYFNRKINSFDMGTGRPRYAPGWKIYENDILVYTETTNHTNDLEPAPYNVSYVLSEHTAV